eukprot:scaffold151546_cov31-Attheya_sp.AAC.1
MAHTVVACKAAAEVDSGDVDMLACGIHDPTAVVVRWTLLLFGTIGVGGLVVGFSFVVAVVSCCILGLIGIGGG